MDTSNKPVFASQSLTATLETCAEAFKENALSLDAISDDIRNLEKFFRDHGVSTLVEARAGDPNTLEHSYDPRDVPPTYLAWRKNGSSSSFRIMVVQYTLDFEHQRAVWDMPFDGPFAKETDYEYCKPLIESKAEIRREFHQYLPELVKAVAKKIRPAAPATPDLK